jgi:hypothetical protein
MALDVWVSAQLCHWRLTQHAGRVMVAQWPGGAGVAVAGEPVVVVTPAWSVAIMLERRTKPLMMGLVTESSAGGPAKGGVFRAP